jgi:NADPH:quinone reductase-like Zn-dependent oxidoreductase
MFVVQSGAPLLHTDKPTDKSSWRTIHPTAAGTITWTNLIEKVRFAEDAWTSRDAVAASAATRSMTFGASPAGGRGRQLERRWQQVSASVDGGHDELGARRTRMTSSSIVPQTNEERTLSTMMAWRVHEFGPPEVMKFERVQRPEPGPGEVLVKVEAAGVGPWDGWIRAGKSALPQPLPLILGSDIAGEIVAMGSDVAELRVGQKVYGVTNPQFVGAYAEYAVASAGMVSTKPTALTHVEAASLPVVSVTAWQALFDYAQLKAGQTVVVHGAAGNVGSFVVQLARHAGVHTIATVSTGDISIVRHLGANAVIDYRTQRFEEEVRGADAVIDLVGGETQIRSFQVLRRGGKLISAVSRPDQDLAKVHDVEATFFLVNVTTRYLTEITRLVDGGKLRTRVGAVLPLADARDAHLMLERVRPQPKGKIVLDAGAS